MSAQHGEYVPGWGYYDASRGAYVDSPAQVTPTRHDVPAPRPMEGVTFRQDTPTTEELRRRGNARAFRVDPEMENLRRLRDSDRREERETFDRLAYGHGRMSLGAYESTLRDYLADGGELPDGVAPPKEG